MTYSKCTEEAKKLVLEMTTSEKASLCSGAGFWNTKSIERLGIPSFMVTDGPHGLRKQGSSSDHLGINGSVPATCFPTAAALACSFDRDLIFEMGSAIAEECISESVSVVLGPGVNIKRSPLCGRNFEYFSEDPLLAGELAASMINGIQSKNIGTSIKHYLLNNQEKARMISDSIVDKRAMREIYMLAFEIAIKKAKPRTVMCSYNKINGVYASDNKEMMTDVLRGEWGFDGAVITDWGAMHDKIKAIEAGVDLEMPPNGGASDAVVVQAVEDGLLKEEHLNLCAERLTSLALWSKEVIRKNEPNEEKHNELARKVARESAVLLKNDPQVLPLTKNSKLAIIGEFARTPRYQGGGSSKINPTKVTSFLDELKLNEMDYTFAAGYRLDDESDDALIEEAVSLVMSSDNAIVFVGLPDSYESEGFDRTHIQIPPVQNEMMKRLAETGKSIVVIVSCGSPIDMPWRNDVSSILLMYLAGQNCGGAVFDLVFGDYSPCGKLAETFPLDLKDTPSFNYYGPIDAEYRESIYVGYRYYDKADKDVAYPFGFGLSYTTFEYNNLEIDKSEITENEIIKLSVDVTNVGNVEAKETSQLYISYGDSKSFRARRELKGFSKTSFMPGEKKTLTFVLDTRAFAFYNVDINDWAVESGEYVVEVGSSSRNLLLSQTITFASKSDYKIPDCSETAPVYYNPNADISREDFEALLGRKINPDRQIRPFTIDSTFSDIQASFFGRIFINKFKKAAIQKSGKTMSDNVKKLIDAVLYETPLRAIAMLSNGAINPTLIQMEGFIDILNGKLLRGLIKINTKQR